MRSRYIILLLKSIFKKKKILVTLWPFQGGGASSITARIAFYDGGLSLCQLCREKLPPACCATFNFRFFCFSITNTLARQTTRRFQSEPFLVSSALVAPISRGNGACIQTRHMPSSPPPPPTAEINSRADFLRRIVSCVCKAWTLTRMWNGTGCLVGRLDLLSRVFFRNALNAPRRRIEDKFGRKKLMRIEVPGNSRLLFG